MIEREILKDVPISGIHANPANPRRNDAAVAEVKKSIQSSDYISPIIVDENHMILAGHTRYRAMMELNHLTIPIIIKINGLTEEQKKRFILADNKTQEFAEWDWGKMRIFTEDLLKETGFSSVEIDKIFLDDHDAYVQTRLRDDVDIKTGDLIQIGPHRVLCGDSTKAEDYEKLFGKRQEVYCPKCKKKHLV
jgi:site-specific DNA-methyltransferase (adenine-specific)